MVQAGVILDDSQRSGSIIQIDHSIIHSMTMQDGIEIMDTNEATTTIVRGFLRVDIEGLPPQINIELHRAVEASEKELM